VYHQVCTVDDIGQVDSLGLLELGGWPHLQVGSIGLEGLYIEPKDDVLHAPALDRVLFKALQRTSANQKKICTDHTRSMVALLSTARNSLSESIALVSFLVSLPSMTSLGLRLARSPSLSSVVEIDIDLVILRPRALRNSGELSRLLVVFLASNYIRKKIKINIKQMTRGRSTRYLGAIRPHDGHDDRRDEPLQNDNVGHVQRGEGVGRLAGKGEDYPHDERGDHEKHVHLHLLLEADHVLHLGECGGKYEAHGVNKRGIHSKGPARA